MSSHHHPSQKQSAINLFVHRAFTIYDKEHLQTELNHLKLALQKNGYDKKDIIKTINKHANKTMVSDTQLDERILSIFPYVKGTTDRIGRILNTISALFLSHPKNRPNLNKSQLKNFHSASQVYTKYLVPADIHQKNRENSQPTDKRTST